jgi:ABC-2 type transport system ATP-binding protein
MRQKLAIARALLHEPPVLFLDEPTAGLDPEAARTVRDFITSLRREGRTIFLTTHNLTEADELCDTIGVFDRRLLRMGTPAQLRVGLFGAGSVVSVSGNARDLVDAVRALPFVRHVSADGDRLSLQIDDPDASNPELIEALVRAGARIRYVEPIRHSLEDVYLRLLHGER